MALAKDFIGIGVTDQQSIREGDTIAFVAPSAATNIGFPTGPNIIELGSAVTASQSGLVFVGSTDIDRTFIIYNTGTAATIQVPASTGAQAGTGAGLFQTSACSFTLTSAKTAFVTRLGPIPSPTGSIASDRWIYQLSA